MSLVIDAVNFDCSDPRRVAEFWAVVTGVDDVGYSSGPVEVSMGGNVVSATEEWASIRSDIPGFPTLVFGRVPEGKTVKNRIHLDLEADDMKAEAARLVKLGATIVQERKRGSSDVWTVLHDPEGNEFCVGQG